MLVDNSVIFKADDGTEYDSTDWGLVLTEHADEQKPRGKWNYVDVPGAAGSLDLSRALSRDVPPDDRTVTLRFGFAGDTHAEAVAVVDAVTTAVHLQHMRILTPDNAAAGLWYEGNVEVASFEYIDTGCYITVNAVCSPFRYASSSSALYLTPGTSTELQGAVLALADGQFDTPGLQFDFDTLNGGYFWSTPSLGVLCAATDNLFDLDLCALRGKTVRTGSSWVKSNNIAQDGQTVDFGGCNLQWIERATVNATSATSGIDNVRIPFSGDTHCYVFIHADTVTAKGNVVADGVTYAPRVRVEFISNIGGSIGDDGIVSTGSSSSGGSISSISTGSEIDTVIDCGVVPKSIGQIVIDVVGITSASVTANVMFTKDGVTASQWVEPSVTFERVSLPQALERKRVNGSLVMDTYKSIPPYAVINKLTAGATVQAPSFRSWARDARYCEFASVNASGEFMSYPMWDAHVTVWSTSTGTVDAGDMPVYPDVLLASEWDGAVVAYNGTEHIVNGSGVRLDTPFHRGNNTVEWVRFTSSTLVTPFISWTKGVL